MLIINWEKDINLNFKVVDNSTILNTTFKILYSLRDNIFFLFVHTYPLTMSHFQIYLTHFIIIFICDKKISKVILVGFWLSAFIELGIKFKIKIENILVRIDDDYLHPEEIEWEIPLYRINRAIGYWLFIYLFQWYLNLTKRPILMSSYLIFVAKLSN